MKENKEFSIQLEYFFVFISYLQKTKKDSARASNTVKEELRKTKTSLAFYKSQIEVFDD